MVKSTRQINNTGYERKLKVETRWYMGRYTQSLIVKLNVEYLSTQLY